MRHSCAHLLATAVQKMYPTAKFGVGPAVDDGFYYDISLPQTINDVELKQIEKTMKKLTNQKLEMKREEMFIDEAIEFFKSKNQDFKVELLKDLKERGTTKVGEDLSGFVEVLMWMISVGWERLNLPKWPALIGEVMIRMRRCNEFMDFALQLRKSLMRILKCLKKQKSVIIAN
ncbi:MAG: Threonine-tRNA ligase [Candidatus Uhrbacteria bacterium GW2011_GWE2_41_1153]|nr:MAG: Threonine-tRNA ligase [Candidatus Uhrbacteria bacterium GW2011_GWE2_41_1153]